MVTPYLVAANGMALLDFAIAGFGAKEWQGRDADGSPRRSANRRLRADDRRGHSRKKFPGSLQPNALHVYVEDADAVSKGSGGRSHADRRTPRSGLRRAFGRRERPRREPVVHRNQQGCQPCPKGLHNVNPYLHPQRAEPLIGFLKRAFEAQEIMKYVSPDGVVNHAEIRVGDSVVEMGEAHGKYETMPAMFYVYVPNVEAVYQQALAAGAKSFQEPTDQPYGDRNAACKTFRQQVVHRHARERRTLIDVVKSKVVKVGAPSLSRSSRQGGAFELVVSVSASDGLLSLRNHNRRNPITRNFDGESTAQPLDRRLRDRLPRIDRALAIVVPRTFCGIAITIHGHGGHCRSLKIIIDKKKPKAAVAPFHRMNFQGVGLRRRATNVSPGSATW